MVGFLKRIFSGSERRQDRPSASAVMAAQDLERIERELERIGSGYEAARLMNRAGDLCLVQEDREGALVHYGGAIDAYLQAGEYDNAMAVCRKIIRMVPEEGSLEQRRAGSEYHLPAPRRSQAIPPRDRSGDAVARV